MYVAYLDVKLSWMSFIIITFRLEKGIRITSVIYVLLHFILGHFIKVMKRQGEEITEGISHCDAVVYDVPTR